MTPMPCAVPPSASAPLAALLLLIDGRFPAGGHAHSGGLEAAAAGGRVQNISTLEAFLRGRAATTGLVAAAFAAAACALVTSEASGSSASMDAGLLQLDAELDARIPSAALRVVSRKLGRQILRALRVVRPDPRLEALAAVLSIGAHQPIALGVAATAVGLDPYSAALAAVYESVTGPATAAIRLLGLDPSEVYAVLVRLAAEVDGLAFEAVAKAAAPPDDLPSCSAPLLDILAEHHARWEMRLFAS